jgi:pyrrolidone-carboxylate peptidase
MKWMLLGLLISVHAFAKPTVLVSYFDPFQRAKVNNSEAVAKLLLEKSQIEGLPFEIKLCPLQTKYDVSYEQLKDCISALPEHPIMVISLGETGCNLKMEMMGRNLDNSRADDNAGMERRNMPIVRGGPSAVGLTYPADEMFCALEDSTRKDIIISNSAGSFVCNNITYTTAVKELDLNFGFIHVPSHQCADLKTKNEKAAGALLTMINRGVDVSLKGRELRRLPVTREELAERRNETANDTCLSSFYKNAKSADEKMLLLKSTFQWMN